MKIELVKKTTAIHANVWYFVQADGLLVSGTLTDDPEEAEHLFNEVFEKAKIHPTDVYETIISGDIGDE